MGYSRRGQQSIHPLDEVLQLPARSFSYELQRRIAKAVVQGPFREAGERIAEITGTPVPVRSLEEVIQEAAQDFDAFYLERTPPISTATSSILVAAVDGKGIPMIKAKGEPRAVRRTKGQRANRKKRPPWPRCLHAPPGFALRSRWWKAFSAQPALLRPQRTRLHDRSISGCGPASPKARRP